MVYIIVPAYNEEIAKVKETIATLLAFTHEIIIVDDGSLTPLKDHLLEFPIHYIRHSINLGQGAALQTGTEYALRHNAKYIIHFDADGQHPPQSINSMVNELEKGDYDLILGSRFLNKEFSKSIPLMRKVILKGAIIINYVFTGLMLSDAHNGFRALNRKAAQQIILSENRFAHATEILNEIKIHKLRYKEIPIRISYSSYSLNKGQKNFNLFTILIDLILNKLFKKS